MSRRLRKQAPNPFRVDPGRNPAVTTALSAVVAVAGLLASAALVGAFGTIGTSGQSREHEMITRSALQFIEPHTLDRLAGSGGSFGDVGYPDSTVQLQGLEEAHCDGGDWDSWNGGKPSVGTAYPQKEQMAKSVLQRCRAWMKERFDRAVAEAATLAEPTIDNTSLGLMNQVFCSSTKCEVLLDLGIMLHAAQDFYSHTNWVDIPDSAKPLGPLNPPGLGMSGAAPWLDLRQEIAFPTGLISGCFDTLPESSHCNYGPQRTLPRAKHLAINKDKGQISDGAGGSGPMPARPTTPRGLINGNFDRAVIAAGADTTAKWRHFEERLEEVYGPFDGPLIACVMRRDIFLNCVNNHTGQLPPKSVSRTFEGVKNSDGQLVKPYDVRITISPAWKLSYTPEGRVFRLNWYSAESRWVSSTLASGTWEYAGDVLQKYPEQYISDVRVTLSDGSLHLLSKGDYAGDPEWGEITLPPKQKVRRVELVVRPVRSVGPDSLVWQFEEQEPAEPLPPRFAGPRGARPSATPGPTRRPQVGR